ncbi:HWE histidine kinase domain-containing protein [Fulvimarina sp. MAC8]|uniref:sensor histidine kinase n=1 Tax=Fulvimarina sp. MAC8 TaxID=3162874 RepID=UPI0032EB0436
MSDVNASWSEADRSRELARYEILDTPREKDFDDLAELASEICQTPIAVVNLVDTGRQFFKAEVGLGVRETPLETSFCGHAILAEDMMIVPDAALDPRFAGNPLVSGAPGLRFYAGALLKTAAGLPIGTMCVLDYQPRTLNEFQTKTLSLLARQAMTQIELRRTLAEKDHALEAAAQLQSRQRDIVTEMSHRMKNTLAMVQAIVTQTLRQSGSTEDARAAISARLTALARAQDVLVRPDADEVDIREVIESALGPHETAEGRFQLTGPAVMLGAQHALGLSLGLHELATNAAKYGALSTGEGHIEISWSNEPFAFGWREIGGPPVSPPSRSGFGSQLVERIVASYFDGTAVLSFDPTGVAFRLSGKLAQTSIGPAP